MSKVITAARHAVETAGRKLRDQRGITAPLDLAIGAGGTLLIGIPVAKALPGVGDFVSSGLDTITHSVLGLFG